MAYVIKAAVADTDARQFTFRSQKNMYGGKGLIARGVVTAVVTMPVKRKDPKARVTPRVSIEVRRVAKAKRALGRDTLRAFTQWDDGRPQTELANHRHGILQPHIRLAVVIKIS